MTGARILFVDDEPEIVDLLVQMFPECEHAIAQSVEDALEKLRAGPHDVLITDVKLPGGSGLDLAKEARKLQPSILVIVITGHFQAGEESDKSLIAGFLLKPFRRADIRAAVSAALERRAAARVSG